MYLNVVSFLLLKRLLKRLTPAHYEHLQKVWTDYRLHKIEKALVSRLGRVVQSGPFAGMLYVPQAVGSAFVPKLVGSYEEELHEVITSALSHEYQSVIDIGCAEGYYAIGVAVHMPEARVYAFDIDSRARKLCTEMARANGVSDRVSVRGACDMAELGKLTGARCLCIVDCEGCEIHLLRPDLVPGLRNCDLLVELHDFIDPSISPTIVSRFSATHEINFLKSRQRNPETYSVLQIAQSC